MKRSIWAFALSIVIISCNHHEHEHQDSSHSQPQEMESEANQSASVTLYSTYHEVFTEYDPLVLHNESNFLIHVTNLDEDYSPFADGSVEVILVLGGNKQILTAGKADVAGIFQVSLAPEQAGEAFLQFLVNSESISDTLTCKAHVFSNDEGVMHAEDHSGASLIRYTKEQAWKSRFNVIEVKPQAFTGVIKTSGEFLAVPGEKQFVTAKTEGIVLFSNTKLVQGRYVNKGEMLFTLSGQGLAENNIITHYHVAQTNFEKSKSDLLRHKALMKENIISEKQFLETQNRYANDSIQFYTLKETFSGNGLRVVSPMDGYLHELNVSEGQFVHPGDILVTISTNKVILLRADLPQQFYPLLSRIVTTNFRPAYSDKVYTLEELAGKLMSRGASVAENNHYLPVYFEAVNDGTLLEGAFAEFYLKTDPEQEQLVIPVTSFIEEQGNYYVYVQVSGEGYEKRAVSLLANDGIMASVGSGLEPGERIVSEGAMLVKTASSSSIPSHSHSH